MSLHVYKKLFPKITNEQLVAMKHISIQLKVYNKTTVTQLHTCAAELENKNNKKKCRFFVVCGNGQALLHIPDIDALNIIKINIHAIGAA